MKEIPNIERFTFPLSLQQSKAEELWGKMDIEKPLGELNSKIVRCHSVLFVSFFLLAFVFVMYYVTKENKLKKEVILNCMPATHFRSNKRCT